jgi:hypothetical protein
MTDKKQNLWPYSNSAAFFAVPLILVLFTAIFSLTQTYAKWPPDETRNIFIMVSVIISFLPLGMVLLDYFQQHGARLDIKGVKIDFGRIDMTHSAARRESFAIPENIGIKGPIQSDTKPMDIIESLEKITKNEIVVVDLKEGNVWWVTRLLALTAGAVRLDSPKAFVFVGKKKNVDQTFLGWSEPHKILNSILNDKDEYKNRYQKSMRISKQAYMYGLNELTPSETSLHNDVLRYINEPDYANLGEEISEQILMDQLGNIAVVPGGSLEVDPDKLKLQRFNDLFGHCLYDDAIDLSWTNEKQVSYLFDSTAPYLALVRSGKYESMLKREDAERLILKELFLQSQQGNSVKEV